MEDDLLRALGARQKQEPLSSPPSDDDDEKPVAPETYLRPFEGDERAALLDGVMERLDKATQTAEPQEAPAADAPIDLSKRRSAGRNAAIAAAVAIAAALVLWLALRPPGPGADGPPLPGYEIMLLEGGNAEVRSPGDPVPEELSLKPGDNFDVVVTPDAPARATLAVAILAEPSDGEARLVTVSGARVSRAGAVRLKGRLSDFIDLTPGTWTLTVLIARPDALPKDVEAARRDPQGRWQAASFRAIILPP